MDPNHENITPQQDTAEQEYQTAPPRRYPVAINMFFGFLSWALPGAAAFFSTPIIVGALGTHDFGIYALVFGFINHSISFSIGKGVTKYVAEYTPAGNYEKINDVISSTLALCLIIGVLATAFLAGGAGWLVRDVMQIPAADQSKTIMSFYLGAAIIFFYTLSQVFSAVLTGLHRFDIYSSVTTFYGVFLAAGSISLALLGYGVIELFYWNLVTNIVVCAVYFINAKRLMPQMKLRLNFPREIFFLVLKFSSGVIAGQVFANILVLFERGFITRYLGTESLTYYVVPMTLAVYIHAFIGSLIMVIFPKASEIGDQREKQIVLYERTTKIVVTIVAFIAVTMISAGHMFLTNWVGMNIAENAAPVLVLQVIIFSLLAVCGITWQLTEGLGVTVYNACLTLSWLVIGVIGMMIFVEQWGIFGVGVGRLMGVLTIPFSILYVEHWMLGKTRWMFWVKLLSVLLVAVALTAVAERLILNNMAVSWLALMVCGAAGAVVYGTVLLMLGWVTKDERELFKQVVFRTRGA